MDNDTKGEDSNAENFLNDEIEKIASSLYNPIAENVRINTPKNNKFTWALELGFLPGVTDNVAHTTTEIIEDILQRKIGLNKVFSSKLIFIKSNISTKESVKVYFFFGLTVLQLGL